MIVMRLQKEVQGRSKDLQGIRVTGERIKGAGSVFLYPSRARNNAERNRNIWLINM